MLSKTVLLSNLKCGEREAAGGPSGKTAEHVRPLLQSSRDCDRFWSMCQALARGSIPSEIVATVRMGRMTALQKPSGGVRGIVVGDIVRTIAQQLGPAVERATAPFQYALTTRAQDASASGTFCKLRPILIVRGQCSPLMAWGLSKSCRGNHCSEGYSLSMVANQSCRLCDNSTVPHPPICGKMMQEASMKFTKVKEANRGTLSCQLCSASDSTALWWPLRGN